MAESDSAMCRDQPPSPRNVADRLDDFARVMPQSIAIAQPTRRLARGRRVYRTVTFRELAEDVDRIARGLVALGVRPGMRLALLVPPSIDFIALVFALLKSGAVQILIDPGMGKRNLLRCLAEAEPEGFVAVPVVHAVRSILRRRFSRTALNVTVGRRLGWGGVTLNDVRNVSTLDRPFGQVPSEREPAVPRTTAGDPAAIIFTSGSTGPPKGVLYRHGNFDRQVTEIRDRYAIQPGEIDLPCFPLFGLFNAAMGVTTVLPRMDFSRPAAVDPRRIVEAVEQWQVTQSFGSPAVWNRVGPYCQNRDIRLRSLRRVMSAGAPVSARVLESMRAVIHPNGEVHVPYGATEALPVATISASEVLSNTWPLTEQGRGLCVGGRFPGIDWRVIRIVDDPIDSIDQAEELPAGEIGELVVRGPVVTTEYVTGREANPLAKIADRDPSPLPDGDESDPVRSFPSFWHRMGDCGYLDSDDRFWFCGRMSQRVETETGAMYTIPIEAQFNVRPHVARSALVGIGTRGRQSPAIVIELMRPYSMRPTRGFHASDFKADMLAAMRQTGVRHLLVYPRTLPVDIRHNAKIARERLAAWAEEQLRRSRSPRSVLLRDIS